MPDPGVPSEPALDRSAEAAPELPSNGLLSFYDRLRERLASSVAKRAGKRGETVAELLLAAPDLLVLLARLTLDPEVPARQRALLGGALAYFVLPADLFPEAFVGVGGYIDDLVLAAAVLTEAFGDELEPWAARYWSGSRRLREVVQDLVRAGRALLGDPLWRRLRRFLGRRGVRLEG